MVINHELLWAHPQHRRELSPTISHICQPAMKGYLTVNMAKLTVISERQSDKCEL